MAYRPIRTTARIQSTTHVQVQANIVHSHLIKYNVLILSRPFSSSQVSLYGPPLNQQCRDDLPRMSNLPLYQSLGPLLGHPLTQPCQDDLYNTMKCPALYPAPYTDAFGTTTGGVLMQDQGDGLQSLTFLSRWLKPTEQRYSAYEWELAAAAYCL